MASYYYSNFKQQTKYFNEYLNRTRKSVSRDSGDNQFASNQLIRNYIASSPFNQKLTWHEILWISEWANKRLISRDDVKRCQQFLKGQGRKIEWIKRSQIVNQYSHQIVILHKLSHWNWIRVLTHWRTMFDRIRSLVIELFRNILNEILFIVLFSSTVEKVDAEKAFGFNEASQGVLPIHLVLLRQKEDGRKLRSKNSFTALTRYPN